MTQRSESEVQEAIRLRAAYQGYRLWRNNVGAGKLDNGKFMRWGLANESTQVNKVMKSADLIGIRPVIITQEMVGQVIGQFVSLEIKEEGWHYRGTDTEVAQLVWRDIILASGGHALFISNPDAPF